MLYLREKKLMLHNRITLKKMDHWFCFIQLPSPWHSLEFSQESKVQMRNCLHQIGLWPCLWGTFHCYWWLTWEAQPSVSVTPLIQYPRYRRTKAEQGLKSKPVSVDSSMDSTSALPQAPLVTTVTCMLNKPFPPQTALLLVTVCHRNRKQTRINYVCKWSLQCNRTKRF